MATFEPLWVRGSSFLLDLGVVPGYRSPGRTRDCAQFSPPRSRHLSICLPHVASLLLLLSYHHPLFLLLAALIPCLSSWACICFSLLSFCLIPSIPQPLSLLLCSLTLVKRFTLSPMCSHSPQSDRFPTAEPWPRDGKATIGHVSIIFCHLIHFAFKGCQLS